MNKRNIAAAFISLGLMAFSVPVFADGLAKPANSGTQSSTTNSGNGSNGSAGDNPNATAGASTDVCMRRDVGGHETKIVCPTDATDSTTGAAAASTAPVSK